MACDLWIIPNKYFRRTWLFILTDKLIRTSCVITGLIVAVFILLTLTRDQSELPGHGQYVCQTFNGRLANHIWQYASIYGIAKLNNMSIILGKDDDLVQYFEVPSATVLPTRKICDTFISLNANHCCHFEPRLIQLEPNTRYKLGEYLQSWKYFKHAQNEVRQELVLKPHIRRSAEDILENYRSAFRYKHGVRPVVVGVHVRVGDFATNPFIKEGGLILPSDGYYYRGFKLFLDRYKHVVFIMCTDTVDYAVKLISGRNETIHLVHTNPIHDFAILSCCDHVLASIGSYGWWAGYLSRGTVVYFATPAREGTHARSEYNYADHFPPTWIGLV